MKHEIARRIRLPLTLLAAVTLAATPALAQGPAGKPDIMFIMGDDIGFMQPSIVIPDINKPPPVRGIAPPCENTPIPGLAPVPGAVNPRTATCRTPPRMSLIGIKTCRADARMRINSARSTVLIFHRGG